MNLSRLLLTGKVNGLTSYFRPTVAEISLDALDHNIAQFRQRVAPGTKLMATVKANAYGHGAVEISRRAVSQGVEYLGVAFFDEALQLRQAGITAPILVYGYTPAAALLLAVEQDITITVFTEEMLRKVNELPIGAKKLKVHVKFDSGMGRLGVPPGKEAEDFLEHAVKIPQLELEGLFTHFACADEEDKSYTKMQAERFSTIINYVHKSGLPIPIIHAGNSAIGIDLPEYTKDMLRIGIGLFGIYPSDEVQQNKVKLEPVLSLKTSVIFSKKMKAGEGIGYGTVFFTQGEKQIGTLPIGYADGFSRMLSEEAEVLIRGQKVPIVGRICMDQCMVDLTPLGASTFSEFNHEEVVLIGNQGTEQITVTDLSRKLGTIPYELICMITHRVPRLYKSNGKISTICNPLIDDFV